MATNLNFHFDPELFLLKWRAAVDPTLTAMYESGAVVNDDTIRQMIANGGNFYTIPQYAVLDAGSPQNYDGATNITAGETSDVAQSGVVFSRMKAWKARDFVRDFNGADPMASISGQVAKWWNKYRQSLMLGLLNAAFTYSTSAAWLEHSTNIVASGSAAGDANKLGATSINDAIQKACGDNKGIFGLAVMHSKVATNLANLNLLQFRKYTDAAGITRTLNIADVNGLTVVVDDGVPTEIDPLTYQATSDTALVAGKTYYTRSGSSPNYTYTAVTTPSAASLSSYYEVATSNTKYTTYLLGAGSILRADAPIEHPVETVRDAITNGGQETLITRVRETMHVNGFSFVQPVGMAASPADSVLTTAANWTLVADPKTIALARIISNG